LIFLPRVLSEPLLEFGDGGRHIDPRFGLMDYGPLQPLAGESVKIGIIGTGETVEGFADFVERSTTGIEGKRDKQGKPSPLANLYPAFPGIGNQNPFRCRFETEEASRRSIPKSAIDDIVATPRQADAVNAGVELIAEQARALVESSARPDVIVIALPVDLICKVVNADSGAEDDEEDISTPLNFRDLLKAKLLNLPIPTQIVWPTLWDDAARIPRKLKDTIRQVQDPATRAWNILNALFYKAGKVPWRLLPHLGEVKSLYLGVGFYKDLTGQRLLTSTAQMFDDRGRGLILRGARAQTDKGDRHPYLANADAHDLVMDSITAYRAHHLHSPARLVILKTSRFEAGEVEGMSRAAKHWQISMRDFVWVQERPDDTLLREGDYPPLRGSFLQLGREGLLFTRGSTPYYGTYPGMRVPRPILLRPYHAASDTPLHTIAAEVMALTKMNWNSTQFDQALPIPIRAAKQVGKILKHVSPQQTPQSDYRYYS
jgi:hypothetical protein